MRNRSMYGTGGEAGKPDTDRESAYDPGEPGYMRDYVLNEKGDVKALYFDHVKKDR